MKAPRWLRDRTPLEAAVLLAFGARSFLGWLVALPLVRAVGESGITAFVEGDRLLFRPGSLWLLELLYARSAALWATFETALVLGLIALLVSTIPSAFLYAAALLPALDHRRGLARALAAAPRFVLIGAVELFAIGLVLGISGFAATGVSSAAGRWGSEPERDLLALAPLAVGLLVIAVLAVVADVARAVSVQGRRPLFAVVKRALGPTTIPSLATGYSAAAGVTCLMLVAAARVTELLRVEEAGLLRLLATGALHQSVLFGLVLVQTFWIRRVAFCVASDPPARQTLTP